MATGTTAYVVVRRDDGFGDVFPLVPGQTYTLGRAATNSIVLKEDLCSRDHAELTYSGNRWRVRTYSRNRLSRIASKVSAARSRGLAWFLPSPCGSR